MRKSLTVILLLPFLAYPLVKRALFVYEGLSTPLKPVSPSRCATHSQILTGSEDIEFICDTYALISSSNLVRHASMAPLMTDRHNEAHRHVGLVVLNVTSASVLMQPVTLLNVPPEIASASPAETPHWAAHGLHISTLTQTVYLVVHTPSFSAVAAFLATSHGSLCEALTAEAPTLSFVGYASRKFASGLINDVVEGPRVPNAVAPFAHVVYVSVFKTFPSTHHPKVDALLGAVETLLPLTRVVACWSAGAGAGAAPMCATASAGFYMANGLAVSPGRRAVFLTDTTAGKIYALAPALATAMDGVATLATFGSKGSERGDDHGAGGTRGTSDVDIVLTTVASVDVRAHVPLPDNLVWDSAIGGVLSVGLVNAGDAASVFMQHTLPPSGFAPSAAVGVRWDSAARRFGTASLMHSEDGTALPHGASSAAVVRGRFVYGSPVDPAVAVCER